MNLLYKDSLRVAIFRPRITRKEFLFYLFLVNVHILYLLKTPENLWLALFSGVMKWEHWPEMG